MIICVKCQIAMYVKKNGFSAVGMDGPCVSEVYSSDLLECPICGVLVAHTAPRPHMEHWEEGFSESLTAITKLTGHVNFWHSVKEMNGIQLTANTEADK